MCGLEDRLIRKSGSSSTLGNKDRQANEKGPHILTDRFPCTQVRLIDEDGPRVISRKEAEEMAREQGVDIILMSPDADPPVVKLMDFGKFRYEAEKKAREAKKKQHVVEVKEIKMSIRIDDHDYGVKVSNSKRFLAEGNKVKCTIRLKGREVQHSVLAVELAKRFVADLEEDGNLDGNISQVSARIFTLVFSPKK